MPKDYVKFTNKLVCMVQGTGQKRGLDLDHEQMTMQLLSKLLAEKVIVNPILAELIYDEKIWNFKTLADLQ